MKILRFEDLDAWKAARELTRQSYRMTDLAAFDSDLYLRRQFRRASFSVMAIIVHRKCEDAQRLNGGLRRYLARHGPGPANPPSA